MMTLDLPTVDAALDLDGTSGGDGTNQTEVA